MRTLRLAFKKLRSACYFFGYWIRDSAHSARFSVELYRQDAAMLDRVIE